MSRHGNNVRFSIQLKQILNYSLGYWSLTITGVSKDLDTIFQIAELWGMCIYPVHQSIGEY